MRKLSQTTGNRQARGRRSVSALCSAKNPSKIPTDDSSKKIMDYWAPSQKMMGDKGFIPRLKEYDKDNIQSQDNEDDPLLTYMLEKFNARGRP